MFFRGGGGRLFLSLPAGGDDGGGGGRSDGDDDADDDEPVVLPRPLPDEDARRAPVFFLPTPRDFLLELLERLFGYDDPPPALDPDEALPEPEESTVLLFFRDLDLAARAPSSATSSISSTITSQNQDTRRRRV